jgi:hypothetical protein
VLEILSFGSQTRITPNKHVRCSLHFEFPKTLHDECFLGPGSLRCEDQYYMLYAFNMPHKQEVTTRVPIWWTRRPQSHTDYSVTTTPVNNAYNLTLIQSQNTWGQNVRNISMRIFGLRKTNWRGNPSAIFYLWVRSNDVSHWRRSDIKHSEWYMVIRPLMKLKIKHAVNHEYTQKRRRLLHCLAAKKSIGSFVIQQVFKKRCQNVCNVLMCIYGLEKEWTQ